MPKAYILVGVPGSGKSTWVKNQRWSNDCVVVSTDRFVEDHARDCGKTYSEVFTDYMPTAVQLMVDQVQNAVENDKDIIWDQTSTTIASRKKKFKMLSGYTMIAVVFRTPERSVLDRRLQSRDGKVIPKDAVDQMISQFEEPTHEEGFSEIWYT